MRTSLIILPLLVCAAPAFAQAPARAVPPPPATLQLPPELTDPATAQKLTNAMQALSRVFLDIKVGEVQAALDGRQPTPQERTMTVRDVARRGDPNFDRRFQQQIATVGPKMQQSMKALNDALPGVMQSLQQASQALERVAANMPDPTYPKR